MSRLSPAPTRAAAPPATVPAAGRAPAVTAAQRRDNDALDFVRGQLKALEPSVGRALPTGIKADRFLRVVLTEISKKPSLATCEISSIFGAVMTAAQLGLEFGPLGHAYLVPFKGKASLIVGYKGYIDLARRSGQLRSIVARPVYAKDHFEFELGLNDSLVHRPTLEGDPGPAVAYYGIARLQEGDPIITVLSPADVERFRQRSLAADDGPWVTDYAAMACKTVVRRMVPWLPMSVEAAQAIESDEQVIEWNGEVTAITTPAEPDDESPAAPAAAGEPIDATSTDDAAVVTNPEGEPTT